MPTQDAAAQDPVGGAILGVRGDLPGCNADDKGENDRAPITSDAKTESLNQPHLSDRVSANTTQAGSPKLTKTFSAPPPPTREFEFIKLLHVCWNVEPFEQLRSHQACT